MVRTMIGYYVVQMLLFFSFAVPGGFGARFGLRFWAVSTCFQLALLGMLFVFRNDFVIETTGEKLVRVNVANRITLFRITTLPTLLFLIIAAKEYRIRTPLLSLVVVVFLTDFMDGYISRKAKQVTRVGRMMDSASDYSLLAVLTIVFLYYRLIPLWMFCLVTIRLGLQSALMGALILVKRKIEPKTTPLGKVAVASIMVLYSVEVLKLVSRPLPDGILKMIEYAVGLILVVSMFDKIFTFSASLLSGGESRQAIRKRQANEAPDDGASPKNNQE